MLIAPLMPGINDAPEQVEPLLERARQAGATNVGGATLHLRSEVREVFMDWLSSQRPDLLPRYRELYRRGAYAPQSERERLSRMVRKGGPPGTFRLDSRTSRTVATDKLEPAPAAQGTLF